MGPTSRAHFGSKASFDEQLSGMAEGYGAWSVGKPDHVVVTPVLSEGDVTLVIVTLVGTIAPEGMTETRADAFPVRITGGTAEPERSEEHTSELQSLIRISYAVFWLQKIKHSTLHTLL